MNPGLAAEWLDIVEAYPGIQHRNSPERVEVTIELAEGRYNRPEVLVAVLIPAGYRSVAPDGFLVPAGLCFCDGSSLPVSDAGGLGMPGLWLVSFHLTDERGMSTWRPTANPRRGDNLVGYLASVEAFLARGCT